jgi:hypothetical protein
MAFKGLVFYAEHIRLGLIKPILRLVLKHRRLGVPFFGGKTGGNMGGKVHSF